MIAMTARLAKHVHGVIFGGNWTAVSLKEHLEDLNWEQATTRIQHFNTIALLVYHVDYFIIELARMLRGAPLEAKDELSFAVPEITCEEDWQQLRNKLLADGEMLETAVAEFPESQLASLLGDEKYGDFLYNIMGTIEHTHYHLGQIVILKKLISPVV